MAREGSGAAPPPGWYQDPSGRDQLRWWNGRDWTEELQGLGPPLAGEDPGVVPGEPTATPLPKPGKSTSRGRRTALLSLAVLLVVGGSLAGGVAIGWTLSDEWAGRQTPEGSDSDEDDDEPATATFDADVASRYMPDVRGLDAETAVEVLADAGIAPYRVSLDARPWAGASGVVVEQTPGFASPDPDEVTLAVSEPATVPDLLGDDAGEAASELEDLGVIVRSVRRYEGGAAAGSVLALDPQPGADLPSEIEIEVAAPSSSVFLASMPLVEGSCGRGEVAVDGQEHPDALTCRIRGDDVEHEWVLSRAVARVEGTIGVPDTGSNAASLAVEVLADGETLDTVTTSYGRPATIDVSVRDALRLTLRSSEVGEDDDGSTPNTELVIADVRLVGGSDDLDRLRDDS